jgi:hypothetical protein
MSLVEIEKTLELLTDKNTVHSYLPLYDDLLQSRRLTAKNVLEVGICYGGSVELWSKYFENAAVCAIDVIPDYKLPEKLKDTCNLISGDAYSPFLFSALFRGKKFDFVIDDGPHTLESQIKFLSMYSLLLEDDGILIIEDVQSIHYLDILTNNTPDCLKPFIKTFDLRKNKGRYDDIVFCIDRSK